MESRAVLLVLAKFVAGIAIRYGPSHSGVFRQDGVAEATAFD
jgi:hypothetical protein